MPASISLAVRASGAWQAVADRMTHFRAEPLLSRGLDRLGQQTVQKLAAATPRRTGRAAAGWSMHRSGSLQVQVSNSQSYARFLVTGTRPHMILPRRGGYLAFLAGGRPVFALAVHHPGTKPNARLRQVLEGVPADGRLVLVDVARDMTQQLRG